MNKRTWWVVMLAGLVLLLGAAGPADVTFFAGHQNGKVTGFDRLDLSMFKALTFDSRFYTEVWFHEMQFRDQNMIVIVNIQLHNLGLSNKNADTYITVSSPELGLLFNKDSNGAKSVKIDPQGFGITAGKSRIELAGDVYKVRYQGKDIKADLIYHPLTGSYQQGNGKVVFGKTGDFVMHNFPIPWAKITGTLTVKGKEIKLDGMGSMNHDRQVLSPLRYMSRWRAFWFYTSDATIGMVRASAPDLKGVWSQRLLVAEQGRLLFASHDYRLEELDPAPVHNGGAVQLPRRFKVEAVAGDDYLRGEIKVTAIPEVKNVLADYPFLFRKLAEAVTDETWSYRFWCDFKFEFRQDGKTRAIMGKGTGNFVDMAEKKN
jgi:hypothetical protein